MALRIIPFVSAYTEQCVDLLQHLWKETAEERLAHFEWAYPRNPNNEGIVAAVIAVSDENQVLGFRGFHLLKAYWGGIRLRTSQTR